MKDYPSFRSRCSRVEVVCKGRSRAKTDPVLVGKIVSKIEGGEGNLFVFLARALLYDISGKSGYSADISASKGSLSTASLIVLSAISLQLRRVSEDVYDDWVCCSPSHCEEK